MSESYEPTPEEPPFARLGGEAAVRALAQRFYDVMSEEEPALARLHDCDETGRVEEEPREKFALFLIGWLGGPQLYLERYGHPRLRMRHAHVPVDEAMADAWLRAMRKAMASHVMDVPVRTWLDARFAQLAEFLRNRP